MTCKDILKLSEGTHVVTVNTERCMVIRMREGYTLTRFLPDRTMLIQLYSEKGHLLREDRLDNFLPQRKKLRKITRKMNRRKTMKILIVEPGRHPRKADIPHTLSNLQAVVGGYIQAVYPWDDPVALVCDEEGLLKQLDFNRFVAPEVPIFGTFFLCGLGEEDFADLPDDLMEKYSNMLYDPQYLIRARKGR